VAAAASEPCKEEMAFVMQWTTTGAARERRAGFDCQS
jgi:hypothetical protein